MTRAAALAMPAPPRAILVDRRGSGLLVWLRELWEFRELTYFLVWRDLKVRYKQTVIGIVWAVLQPLALMLVFTLFFGTLARMPSEGIPYPLFAYAGLLPWQMFSRGLSESANSLVADQRLITRVYFPRLIVPIATIVAALVDFAMAAALLLVLMPLYGQWPSPNLVWLPLFLLVLLAASLGVGFWLSALNLEFRDVRYIVPFLSQLWMFLTPVVYPTSLVPPHWQWLYAVNPMVGVVEGFRWALFGTGQGLSPTLVWSSLVAVGLCLSGAAFFRTRERTFADVVGSGGR